ncbi:MAG: hypothetical protein Q8R37_03705 [Nanoarchaeota archaeon]|nr:hypothetical protein [Nanoarchaeota archaeon]
MAEEAERANAAREEKEAAEEREKAARAEKKIARQEFAEKLSRAGSTVGEFFTKKRSVSPAITGSALKLSSVLIIILGLFQYFLRLTLSGTTTLTFYLSLFLFALAGYALAVKVEKDKVAIFIPMVLFVIWYFGFQGSLTPSFLLTYLLISMIVLALPAILTKGEAAKPELYGLLPVLFLFLDIGLIPWLIENFQLPVTPFLDSLVFFMPWWTLFGLFVIPETENKTFNFIAALARIAGVIYILMVLIVPLIPDIGYDSSSSLLPELSEFEQAQARLRGKLPQGENPFVSNIACAFSNPVDVPGCIQERQLLSSLKIVCQSQNIDEGTEEFDTCLDEEREKQKQALVEASGTVDPSFKEVTTAEFIISEQFFPKETVITSGQELTVHYPATVKVKNPRRQEITFDFSCFFTKGSTTVPGVVSLQGETKTTITIVTENNELPITCTPSASLDGSYKLVYEATLSNLKTTSSLKRAFIGMKSDQEKQQIIDQLSRTTFRTRLDSVSQAPDEFARINFGFGKTADDPYIAADDSLILVSSVTNNGVGKINHIRNYQIKVLEKGFTVKSGDIRCVEGSAITVPETISSRTPYVLPYSSCFLALPETLQQFDAPFRIETFFADLIYDYTIKKEIPITVKVEMTS